MFQTETIRAFKLRNIVQTHGAESQKYILEMVRESMAVRGVSVLSIFGLSNSIIPFHTVRLARVFFTSFEPMESDVHFSSLEC